MVIRVHTKVVLVEGRPEDDWTEERRVAIMPKEANMKDQQLSTNPHPSLLTHLPMTADDSEFFLIMITIQRRSALHYTHDLLVLTRYALEGEL